ncbi:MAG: thioredoxin family protein [Gemmatimonadota bacterium]|nr:MAG: thioredoxin family protein [Gemmatimonadota bacterium]
MDLTQYNVVVVVFIMEGCPACHEYVPRFQHIARQFGNTVPAFIVDANSPQGGPLADRFGIEATPTTMILRKPVGAIRAEGSLPDTEITEMFKFAGAHAA